MNLTNVICIFILLLGFSLSSLISTYCDCLKHRYTIERHRSLYNSELKRLHRKCRRLWETNENLAELYSDFNDYFDYERRKALGYIDKLR